MEAASQPTSAGWPDRDYPGRPADPQRESWHAIGGDDPSEAWQPLQWQPNGGTGRYGRWIDSAGNHFPWWQVQKWRYLGELIVVAEGAEVLQEIADERRRQVAVENWTAEGDDEHAFGQMAMAAACYAESSTSKTTPHSSSPFSERWPWAYIWWKPKSPLADLRRAGALIVAEMQRLKRAKAARP